MIGDVKPSNQNPCYDLNLTNTLRKFTAPSNIFRTPHFEHSMKAGVYLTLNISLGVFLKSFN